MQLQRQLKRQAEQLPSSLASVTKNNGNFQKSCSQTWADVNQHHQ
jgi:hypothetical protein